MKEGVCPSARINLDLNCTLQLSDLAESSLYILFDLVIKINMIIIIYLRR